MKKRKVIPILLSAMLACSATAILFACGNKDAKTYSVTYAKSDLGETGDVPTDTAKYAEGKEVTVKGAGTLALSNYTFSGWVYNGTTYTEGQKITMPNKDITLKATWTANETPNVDTYTLTFSSNRTDVVTLETTYKEGDSVTMPDITDDVFKNFTAMSKIYKFDGWTYFNADEEEVTLKAGETYTMTASNMGFSAKWKKIGATVSVYLNTDETIPLSKTDYLPTDTLDIPDKDQIAGAATMEDQGYTFIDWYVLGETPVKFDDEYELTADDIANDVTVVGFWNGGKIDNGLTGDAHKTLVTPLDFDDEKDMKIEIPPYEYFAEDIYDEDGETLLMHGLGVKEGAFFYGWNITLDGSTEKYFGGEYGVIPYGHIVTLTAVWQDYAAQTTLGTWGQTLTPITLRQGDTVTATVNGYDTLSNQAYHGLVGQVILSSNEFWLFQSNVGTGKITDDNWNAVNWDCPSNGITVTTNKEIGNDFNDVRKTGKTVMSMSLDASGVFTAVTTIYAKDEITPAYVITRTAELKGDSYTVFFALDNATSSDTTQSIYSANQAPSDDNRIAICTPDNATAWGNMERQYWTSIISKGEKLTLSGTMTSKAINNWDGLLLSLYSGLSAKGKFRVDNFIVDDGPMKTAEGWVIKGTPAIEKTDDTQPDEKDEKFWAPARVIFTSCNITVDIDWLDASQIVITIKCDNGANTFTQTYTITAAEGKILADSYTIGLDGESSYTEITGLERSAHVIPEKYSVTWDLGDGSWKNDMPAAPEVNRGYPLELPSADAVTNPGFKLTGWKVNGTPCEPGVECFIYGDVTVIAVWGEAEKYDLSFEIWNQDVEMNAPEAVKIIEGTEITLSDYADKFTKNNYQPVRWIINGEVYDEETYLVEGPITLTAILGNAVYTQDITLDGATDVKEVEDPLFGGTMNVWYKKIEIDNVAAGYYTIIAEGDIAIFYSEEALANGGGIENSSELVNLEQAGKVTLYIGGSGEAGTTPENEQATISGKLTILTGVPAVVTFFGNQGPATQTVIVAVGGTITLPEAPQAPEYFPASAVFAGWYTQYGNKLTDETVIDRDLYVTARWSVNANYALDGGNWTGDEPADFVFVGYTFTLPSADAVSKPNSILTGWTIAEEGEEPYDVEPGAESTYFVNGAVTITAKWGSSATHSVSYELGEEANWTDTDPSGTVYEGNITLPVAGEVEKDGYVLTGWTIGGTPYNPGATYTVEDDVTITAVWEKGKALDTLTLTDWAAAVDTVSVKYGQTATLTGDVNLTAHNFYNGVFGYIAKADDVATNTHLRWDWFVTDNMGVNNQDQCAALGISHVKLVTILKNGEPIALTNEPWTNASCSISNFQVVMDYSSSATQITLTTSFISTIGSDVYTYTGTLTITALDPHVGLAQSYLFGVGGEGCSLANGKFVIGGEELTYTAPAAEHIIESGVCTICGAKEVNVSGYTGVLEKDTTFVNNDTDGHWWNGATTFTSGDYSDKNAMFVITWDNLNDSGSHDAIVGIKLGEEVVLVNPINEADDGGGNWGRPAGATLEKVSSTGTQPTDWKDKSYELTVTRIGDEVSLTFKVSDNSGEVYSYVIKLAGVTTGVTAVQIDGNPTFLSNFQAYVTELSNN